MSIQEHANSAERTTRRLLLIALAVVALGVAMWMLSQRDGTSNDVPTVAIYNLVSHPILDASVDGIKAGLAERGYSGDAIHYIEVNANGQMEMLNAFAQELLAADPAVIVPVSTPITQAVVEVADAGQAVVFSTVTNPDDVGMSDQPPNMTGVSDAVNYEANIDLIQELFPESRNIGVVYNPGERNSQFGVERTSEVLSARSLTVLSAVVSGSGEVGDATRSLVDRVDVIYVGSDNTVVSGLDALLSVASQSNVPVIASDAGSVERGALAAVSVDYERVGREAGFIVATVLDRGLLPGEIEPVVVRGDALILNLGTAESLGIEIPDEIRSSAVRVVR